MSLDCLCILGFNCIVDDYTYKPQIAEQIFLQKPWNINKRKKTVMYSYNDFMEKLNNSPVVPVVAVEKKADVLPLAEALIKGNCKIIEITLRTKEGIDAIRLLNKSDIDILVGAGTVTNTDQFKELEDIGVDFIVSPGGTDQMLQYAAESTMAYLPGVMTSSEILKL